MDTICDYLVIDHRRCEEFFEQAQSDVKLNAWDNAESSFRRFHDAMKQHIVMEEKVLFPAFLQNFRNSEGPITMLRIEHRRIRTILERMSDSLAQRDVTDFYLHAETFVLLMQEHHVKEEDMLYPLLDRALSSSRGDVISAMSELLRPGADDTAR